MRESVERDRCVVVFGVQEKEEKDRIQRSQRDSNKVKEIVKKIDEEEMGWDEDILEVTRMGEYKKEGFRPIRVKFGRKRTAQAVQAWVWKLSRKEGYQRILVRKDLNEEERGQLKAMIEEVKEKNDRRTEAEKQDFYWRVKDMRVKKWFIKK